MCPQTIILFFPQICWSSSLPHLTYWHHQLVFSSQKPERNHKLPSLLHLSCAHVTQWPFHLCSAFVWTLGSGDTTCLPISNSSFLGIGETTLSIPILVKFSHEISLLQWNVNESSHIISGLKWVKSLSQFSLPEIALVLLCWMQRSCVEVVESPNQRNLCAGGILGRWLPWREAWTHSRCCMIEKQTFAVLFPAIEMWGSFVNCGII